MKQSILINAPGDAQRLNYAQAFCRAFTDIGTSRPRVLFGRNIYAKDLIHHYPIQAVVDDFCADSHFEGIPVIRADQIPSDALVLALSGGRPLTVKDRLDNLGLEHLDYFAFEKHAGIPLRSVVFNEGFARDYEVNRGKYEWVDELLADDESRKIYRKLVSFRYKGDVELMRGFNYREPEQYFEPFLALQPTGEVFYDVGCFDGYTSKEFMRHCPGYQAVHAFEPESANFQVCQANLLSAPRTTVHPFGLSDASADLKLSSAGSGSTVCTNGSQSIRVEPLDTLNLLPPPTFLKMDIEGAEMLALEGAKRTISKHHPRLALAVYHHALGSAPFWQIPEQVLAIRPDYEVRLRHYTESIYETVMFFLPKRG